MFDLVKVDYRVFQQKHGKGVGPILYYPMFSAILLYRCSSFLYKYKTVRPVSYLLFRLNDFLHGVWIGSRVVAGAGLFFGHARGLVVNPETIIGENCTILHRVTLGGPNITIGNNVEIGANATIISRRGKGTGVSIGNNVIIGAGAVVIHNVPDNAIVADNPAKVLRYKNEE